MKIYDIKRILDKISYKDWTFRLGRKGDDLWLRVEYMGHTLDEHNVPQMKKKRGKKWLLPDIVKPSTIIQTAFKAVLMAEKKEINQRFCVDGSPYFGSSDRRPLDSDRCRCTWDIIDERCKDAADAVMHPSYGGVSYFDDLPNQSLSEPWPKEGITKMTKEHSAFSGEESESKSAKNPPLPKNPPRVSHTPVG